MNQEKTIRKWLEQKEKFASKPSPDSFVISPRFVVSSWRFPAILPSFVIVVAFTETTLCFYDSRNRNLKGPEGIIATGVSSGADEGFGVLMILNVGFRIGYFKRIDYF
jgi:ABC-type enterobactin transport system permease subunit